MGGERLRGGRRMYAGDSLLALYNIDHLEKIPCFLFFFLFVFFAKIRVNQEGNNESRRDRISFSRERERKSVLAHVLAVFVPLKLRLKKSDP